MNVGETKKIMKKNFLRMKNHINFLGGGKSKDLDDKALEIADDRVENLRKALVDIHKRINYNSTNSNPSDNVDKRMKRYPEYQLAQTLQEHGQDVDHLFGHVANAASAAEHEIAKNRAEHDRQVEELVIGPVHDILERDVPNIAKNKSKLTKCIQDKDAIRSRYNKNGASNETIKEDMEGADQKVEQIRDSLAVDIFGLLRKENELAQIMLQFLKLQKSYHYSALNNLEQVIPELEREIGNSRTKPVFGVELEEHLRVRDLQLAYPLQLCITALLDRDRLSEEGLFRISGSSLKVKRLKLSIDAGCFQTLLSEYDNPVLASTLKLYLRELPDPLLTYSLHDEWLRVASSPECDRLKDVQRLIKRLPHANRTNLSYLIQFMAKVLHNSENKMTASNIAIVIAPNLLWGRNAESNTNMHDTALINILVEYFVKNSEVLFPDDLSHLVLADMYRMLPAPHSGMTSLCPSLSSSRNQLDTVLSDGPPQSLNHTPAEQPPLYADSPKPHNRRKQKPAPTPPVTEHNLNQQRASTNEHNVNPQRKGETAPSPNLKVAHNHTADGSVKVAAVSNTNNNNGSESVGAEGVLGDFEVDPDVCVDDVKEDCCAVGEDQFDDVAEDVHYRNAQMGGDKAVPVAAPRASLLDGVKDTITTKPPHDQLRHHHPHPHHQPHTTPNPTPTQFQSSTLGRHRPRDYDRDDTYNHPQQVHPVQLRGGPSGAKPTIPVRPASLKPIRPSATAFGTTPSPSGGDDGQTKGIGTAQVPQSVGGSANVNSASAAAAAARSAGHDSQLSEKERFLLLAAGNDAIGSSDGANPIPAHVPRASEPNTGQNSVMPQHKTSVNGNVASGHARTRSDGNIVDLSSPTDGANSAIFTRTPPLPRPQLAKPSQPPPPPPTPIAAVTSAQQQPKTDSTDL